MPVDGSDNDLTLNVLVEDLVNLLQVVFPDPIGAPTFFVSSARVRKTSF